MAADALPLRVEHLGGGLGLALAADEIEYLASLREAGGHSTMPVPLGDWREWMTEKHMATKTIGRVKMTNHKTGKVTISPIAKMPVSRKT